MKYGLIGKTLGHSISPRIHGLLGNEEYELKCLAPEDVENFIKNQSWLGLNVTIPYKETVLPFCHSLSVRAKELGSVNTLIKKDGRIYGDNTDYFGFLAMADQAKISFTNKDVTLMGDGGTGKMAKVAILHQKPKSLTVVSLEGDITYSEKESYRHCQILVNTTPVGMYPKTQECLCNLAEFPNLTGVLDVIYNPLETQLLQQARERDISHANGLYMLIEQARCAAELFFETPIASEKTKEIYEKLKEIL